MSFCLERGGSYATLGVIYNPTRTTRLGVGTAGSHRRNERFESQQPLVGRAFTLIRSAEKSTVLDLESEYTSFELIVSAMQNLQTSPLVRRTMSNVDVDDRHRCHTTPTLNDGFFENYRAKSHTTD
jgi:hypothetical protein